MTSVKESPKKLIPLSSIVQANMDIAILGKTKEEAERTNHLPKGTIENVNAKIGEIITSDDPNMALQRQIISEALTDRLKPIKEELSFKSLELAKKADLIIEERLENRPDMISDKNLLAISDIHSKRLARLTGIEEDPYAGNNDKDERNKTVNIMVQNIFQGHKERLERERAGINYNPIDIDPIQGELSPETA